MATARATASTIKSKELDDAPQAKEYNPFWQSTLFHEVYLRNDVPEIFKNVWAGGEEGAFGNFCNSFRNLCAKFEPKEFESWSERTTIRNWITPILEMLGYVDESAKGRDLFLEDEAFSFDGRTLKPDFIITRRAADLPFIQEKSGETKLEEARDYVKVVVEAKYWGRLEDYWNNRAEDRKRADKKSKDEIEGIDPADQVLRYMSMLRNDWGVMTDGKVWRLYHQELSNDSQKRFFQFNLGYLYYLARDPLSQSPAEYETFLENAKYFFHIFNRHSLIGDHGKDTIVNASLEFTKSYAETIEEDLRIRFRDAMIIVCNGFHRAMGKPTDEPRLIAIRDLAESHLFNLMFIKSCESKGVIQMKGDYREKSLTRIVTNLSRFKPERGFDSHNIEVLQRAFSRFAGDDDFQFDLNGTEIYDHLLALIELVQKGSNPKFNTFKIDGFKESVFSTQDWALSSKYKLKNREMILVLYKIGFLEPAVGVKRPKQIPYNSLTPRQLGSIYEGFLEYQLKIADKDIAFIKNKWQAANLSSEKIRSLEVAKASKGEIFFDPDDKKKKDTGSYYTPDCVVRYIVHETLAPLIIKKTSKDILKLRVCDPALGSGHFINATLNFLADAYLKALENEIHDDLAVTEADIKRSVVQKCIFGADINPRAVKLAKMGLWLETAKTGIPLQNLDEHIKCADSLISKSMWESEWDFLVKGIDAIVGNPPYLGEKGHKDVFQKTAAGFLGQFYLGRMDYFYFFFHLGLDLLKDGGRLGFVTTNYFPTASGAKKLRSDLKVRGSINKLVDLNEYKLFKSAAGQHNLITIVSKGKHAAQAEIIVTKEEGLITTSMFESICNGKSTKTVYSKCDSKDLFDGDDDYIRLSGRIASKQDLSPTIIKKIESQGCPITDFFNVNNGLRSGIDKITDKHLELVSGLEKGDGVFVLSAGEYRQKFGKVRPQLLKQYFKNSDISKYKTSVSSDLYIIYSDKETDIASHKEVAVHLNQFQKVIGKVRWKESVPWYSLVRPRKKAMFEGEKIVCPQRSLVNTFGYSSSAWYAGSDVFYISAKPKNSIPLLALTGILNSKLYYCWLFNKGKKKGKYLELIQEPVSEIIIPKFDKVVFGKIANLTKLIIEGRDAEKCVRLIDEALYNLFGLSAAETKFVESFYPEQLEQEGEDLEMTQA